MNKNDFLILNDEVKNALNLGKPIVALESTIITHGMPYPQNLEMAKSVEQVVRDNGAVPATIALMGGKMRAGLDEKDLLHLAKQGHKAAKASRRDMAAIIAVKKMAGTTVATTMQICAMAGIKIFATGGIGGVHKGASETFDISADLNELANTPVAVVCAGAKSILDIAKTLEVLETNGVPVIGYQSDVFPAFYLRNSGYPVDQRFDEPSEIAEMLDIQWQLKMGGVLIANPILEQDEMNKNEIETLIKNAIKAAEKQRISRKNLTPFLLKSIFEMSEGKSLKANIALVKNNAKVAAKIAVAFANKS